ncbi:type I secretion system permease/ATPase [Nordella sp. HKS 07]|uniref:type I secretion system permease/ATPase n=1 Tax=Nordella sp. HKS 07 TaxID=2712222 RepID=UPI0013E1B558|nr:type I secretion system permease/ATPase [Nordella sp. HKS 07]QIG49924.1 type I secretion system permease/ATPase [Nordella sp. HKS 07]
MSMPGSTRHSADSFAGLFERSVRDCKRDLLGVGAFSLVMSLLLLTVPIYMVQVYDRVLGSGSLETLLMLTIITVGALALLAILDGLRQAILVRIGMRFEASVAAPLLAASIKASAREGSYGIDMLREAAQVRSFLATGGVTALFDMPFALIFIVVVFLIHPLLGFVCTLGAVILISLTALTGWAVRRPFKDASQNSLAALEQAQAFIRQADLVHAMGIYPEAIAHWGAKHLASLRGWLTVATRNNILASVSKFVRLLIQIAILGLGGYLTLKHEITGGMIFAASLITSRALQPVESIIAGWKNIAQTRLNLARIRSALADESLARRRLVPPAPEGAISVEKLVYQPAPNRRPVLRGVSFELGVGESLGIVGPAGAGKSTLARILVGTIEPTSGKVRLDGSEISHWPREALGQHMGYLPQQPEFFPGTIAENIARMQQNPPDAAVLQAARISGANEVIVHMQDGYATEIGHTSFELSGGQKQRIGLARAFYGAPRVLVLDEPNANLDVQGDEALTKALLAAQADKVTIIIVAQRPSAIRFVDKLLVLMDGQVEAFGARDEILPRITSRQVSSNVTRLVPKGPS